MRQSRAGTGWSERSPPHLHRARRPCASRAGAVGGLRDHAPLSHAARAVCRVAALRRFRARARALQRKTWRPTLMDTLHNVLRSISETKAKPDHLSVFREFLGHLDRIGKRAAKRPPARKAKDAKSKKPRGKN